MKLDEIRIDDKLREHYKLRLFKEFLKMEIELDLEKKIINFYA